MPRRLGPPTEFELLTAAAFAWFDEQRVDLAVVEVGLGGRLDATNAWDGGVAAVTNVAMDHAAVLGDTIARIAREKAAILKRGDWAVTVRAERGSRSFDDGPSRHRDPARRGSATAGARHGPRRAVRGRARS